MHHKTRAVRLLRSLGVDHQSKANVKKVGDAMERARLAERNEVVRRYTPRIDKLERLKAALQELWDDDE